MSLIESCNGFNGHILALLCYMATQIWVNIAFLKLIRVRETSQEIPQLSITVICFKNNYLRIHSNIQRANELMHKYESNDRIHKI